MATFLEARDDLMKLVTDAWSSTGHPLGYEDRDDNLPPSDQKPWARATVRHGPGGAANIGKTRFEREGTLTVQVFVPRGEGLREADSLAKILTDVLEGASTDNAVWLRNVRVNEIGPDGIWYQHNVLADFIYDEVK